jgi:hypothetical protein
MLEIDPLRPRVKAPPWVDGSSVEPDRSGHLQPPGRDLHCWSERHPQQLRRVRRADSRHRMGRRLASLPDSREACVACLTAGYSATWLIPLWVDGVDPI